jgi:hypothetical protein
MRDRTPKMLDFLGLAPTRKRLKTAQQIPVSRELVNVAARSEEVKCLFVKGQESPTVPTSRNPCIDIEINNLARHYPPKRRGKIEDVEALPNGLWTLSAIG